MVERLTGCLNQHLRAYAAQQRCGKRRGNESVMKRRMYLALERLFTRIEIRADELRELCLMRRLGS
jgi:hypothetical protein